MLPSGILTTRTCGCGASFIWVAGTKGKVYKSLDKGSNWIDVSLKNQTETDIRDIQALDKNTAILMSVGLGQNSRLYKTIDQGLNWKILYQNNDETGFFDSIAFWDEDNGLLLGDPVDGYYVIKKTHDGGETWNNVLSISEYTGCYEVHMDPRNSNILYAVAHQRMRKLYTGVSGGPETAIYRSDDNGENWKKGYMSSLFA